MSEHTLNSSSLCCGVSLYLVALHRIASLSVQTRMKSYSCNASRFRFNCMGNANAQLELARCLCGRAQITKRLFWCSFLCIRFSSVRRITHGMHVCWSLIENEKTIQKLNFEILSICFIASCVGWTMNDEGKLGSCVFIWVLRDSGIQALILLLRNCVRFTFLMRHTFFTNRFSTIQSTICQFCRANEISICDRRKINIK